jgi:hypothetical protein
MVGKDDFSNLKEELNNLVAASALDISAIEASHYLTIMDINDLPFGLIQEYVGMNKLGTRNYFSSGVQVMENCRRTSSCHDWHCTYGGGTPEKVKCDRFSKLFG